MSGAREVAGFVSVGRVLPGFDAALRRTLASDERVAKVHDGKPCKEASDAIYMDVRVPAGADAESYIGEVGVDASARTFRELGGPPDRQWALLAGEAKEFAPCSDG